MTQLFGIFNIIDMLLMVECLVSGYHILEIEKERQRKKEREGETELLMYLFAYLVREVGSFYRYMPLNTHTINSTEQFSDF